MSNDQGIRRKHRQRTVPHGKHSVFPGMLTPKDVTIQNQSIKPVVFRDYAPVQNIKAVTYTNPLWIAYDQAAKKLGGLAGSSAQALRAKNEHEFTQAYKKLERNKLVYHLKRKYRP